MTDHAQDQPLDELEFETDHPSQLSDQYRLLRLPEGETPGRGRIYRQPGGCIEIGWSDETDHGDDLIHMCNEQDVMNVIMGLIAVMIRVPPRF